MSVISTPACNMCIAVESKSMFLCSAVQGGYLCKSAANPEVQALSCLLTVHNPRVSRDLSEDLSRSHDDWVEKVHSPSARSVRRARSKNAVKNFVSSPFERTSE